MRIDGPQITGSVTIGASQLPDVSALATTGSNLFKGTQTLSGSIIPAVNNIYDLGSPTNQFRHVYISTGSLYIDGTKVLGSTSSELQITTDSGQSFKVLETGADTITLQSADGNVTLTSTGGGDIVMDPSTGVIGLKGTVTIYTGNKIVSSDGNSIQFGNGIAITGSIVATSTNLITGSGQISSLGFATTGSNTFNGNLTVTGYIDAQELRTTYISSSILYRSGSTKFGDELTDTHSFTGSLSISGSLSVPNSNLVSGSSQITYSGLSGVPSGIISGSAQVDVMSTTNIARLATTGSNSFNGNQTLTGSIGVNTSYNPSYGLSIKRTAGSDGAFRLIGNDNIVGNSGVHFYNDNTTSGSYISMYTNGGLNLNGVLSISGSNVGIGTVPSFPIDMTTSSSGTFNTIAQFQNTDYTSGNRTFIRVRAWASAGGSYSSYFGTGQDGNLYIIANNSARGGDLIINASTGVMTANGGGLVLSGTASDSIQSSASPFLYLSGGGSSYTTIQQGSSKMRWWQFNGSSWIKTWDIDYNGNATLTGTFTENSSIRYKENVETLKYGLDKVLQMRGVTYNKKDNGIKEMGVIAEEINEILPEVVLKNDEGEVDSVSYGRITAVLIEAIKDLKKEIEDLKSNK
jgi:hypothetical protein